jgi:hypothetical protein
MGNFWATIWNYKISLAPLIVTYLLFDFPALVRKLTGIAYVPIYFIFFPSGHSEQLYAQYFNEDWFYGDGALLTDDQRKALRYRIQATAVISMVFATIIAPWVCGFIAAFYLTVKQFNEFLWVLISVKSILIIFVLRRLRNESRAATEGNSFYYVIILYGAYLLLVWRGLTKSFDWTHLNYDSKGFFGLMMGLADYAYVDVFINIVIVSAVTWGLTVLFTNPAHITRANVSE